MKDFEGFYFALAYDEAALTVNSELKRFFPSTAERFTIDIYVLSLASPLKS